MNTWVLLGQTTQPAGDAAQALELVRQFYSDAWTSLVVVVGLVALIVGVVVPVVIQRLQWRSLDRMEQRIREDYGRCGGKAGEAA